MQRYTLPFVPFIHDQNSSRAEAIAFCLCSANVPIDEVRIVTNQYGTIVAVESASPLFGIFACEMDAVAVTHSRRYVATTFCSRRTGERYKAEILAAAVLQHPLYAGGRVEEMAQEAATDHVEAMELVDQVAVLNQFTARGVSAA